MTSIFIDGIQYLTTEILDFLMTEDSKNIITDQSFGEIPTTIWTNLT